eukprot:gene2453-4766_t
MSSYTCRKSHPYGVQAPGNSFFADEKVVSVRRLGLGILNVLSDDTLLEILSYIDGNTLANTAASSRAIYVYAHHSDLWRDLVLRKWDGNVEYVETWRDTYVRNICQNKFKSTFLHRPILVSGIFSNLLYRWWCCCSFDFESACPGFLSFDDIPRRDASNYSIDEFLIEFEVPNLPVVLTNIVSQWPAYKLWNNEYLETCCKDIKFRTTSTTAPLAATFTMSQYLKYKDQACDEAPLYLFDRDYAYIDNLKNDFEVPCYFSPKHNPGADLFSHLGVSRRPDYRWLIIGPARSGSIFHIDPNQTNAWNAAIRGRKKWIFYPPGVSPPGVMASADGGDVTVPLTTGEWLLSFWQYHLEARNNPDPRKRPIEVIMQPGELIFVPHNWWHMVVNLDDCIALTHNYVSSSNLANCLKFLREKPDQISGVRDRPHEAVSPENIYEEFIDKLQKELPTLTEKALKDSYYISTKNHIDKLEMKTKKRSNCTKHDSVYVINSNKIARSDSKSQTADIIVENKPFSFNFSF